LNVLSATDRDLAVVRLDGETGAEDWRFTWDGGAWGGETARGVALDGRGDLFVIGYTQSTSCGRGFSVFKLDGRSGSPLPCKDGFDQDGDGAMDHPADPGCGLIGDLSELPDCDDGIDNDDDGAVDLADSFCGSASDAREEPDTDFEGVTDSWDNCLLAANPNQLDSNQDGYGNTCDADYNDDEMVGGPDLALLAGAYGTSAGSPGYEPRIDANGDGVIGAAELALFGISFGHPPGPSGLACAGTVP
jgi:hypothetical protein